MLGEKVTATIKAKYYFGAPVAEAKVKYKVTRTTADDRWYPAARWDWLYGPGYWWFAADSRGIPAGRAGACSGPSPGGGVSPQRPPEVVAEAEVPIRPDGTVTVEIDTALAKAAHPDQDHRYEITAEVTDQSRRTIVGTGTVLVARKPFRVYTWVDRGHYRAGDTIEAGIRAQTLDRKPVAGKGTLKLLKITYDAERKPVETPVESWDLALDAEGQARQTIKAAAPGQYRLSCDDRRRQGPHDRGRLPAHDHRPGLRRRELPLQRPRDHPRAEGVPARRDGPAADQHQPGQLHGPALRPADQRRLPAAEGRPPAGQEHGRGDRHRRPATCPTSSSRP